MLQMITVDSLSSREELWDAVPVHHNGTVLLGDVWYFVIFVYDNPAQKYHESSSGNELPQFQDKVKP